MNRLSSLCVPASLVVFCLAVASCEVETPGLYHDYSGNTLSLIGSWGLVEVQYWTVGVMSSEKVEPESLMEFMEDGLGRSLRVIDNDTISSKEKISGGTYLVNIFSRFK